jgi:NACalpha-BTF3-like transcription factor
MTSSPPTPPPRPNFIRGRNLKKINEKRDSGEIWGKIKNIIIAGFMVFCILLGAWLYSSTNRIKRGDTKTVSKNEKDKTEELKEISEKKEAAFEEIKLKKDTLSEDDINLLAEAVKAQEEFVAKKGSLSADNSRLEGLRKKLHIINAETLRAISRQAEEKAQRNEVSNPLESKNLVKQALDSERAIQNKWIYSGMADVGKIARLETRLRRMEATPLWEKTRQCERQAEAYFKEENLELAIDSITEAIKIETNFLENYRDVLNTEFGRIDQLGIRKETFISYPLYKELLALENEAEQKEKNEQWEEAEKIWDQAILKQKLIINKNPLSEYANQKNSAEIEKRRNLARTTLAVRKIKNDLKEIQAKIRDKNYDQAIEAAKKLLASAQKLEDKNPGVLPKESALIQELTFITSRQGMIKIINNAIEGFFIKHPVKKEIKMMRHEVPQSFYEAVMGANPSAVVRGNLPVESVNYEDTQKFCQQLGWLTGTKIRLPTSEEFMQATGSFVEKNKSDQAWTFDNTDGLTTRNVATTKMNNYGFYDLVGNVEEWTNSPKENEEALILGGSVNTVTKNEFPQRKALKRERSRTLGFRVVQE